MNPWWILAVVLAFAGGALLGEWDGGRRADLRWTAKISKERAAAEAASRAQEYMWQEVVNGTVKNYETKVGRIRSSLELALDSLRQRPGRADAVPAGAGNASACCTGAELCREDGLFLRREAARADTQREGLAACHTVLDGLIHSRTKQPGD